MFFHADIPCQLRMLHREKLKPGSLKSESAYITHLDV